MTVKKLDRIAPSMTPSVEKPFQPRIATGGRPGAILDSATDWEMLELRQRIHCGVWCGRVALVMSVPFALTAWATGAEHAWFMFMVLPVVAAFFAGSLFGSAIANRRQVPDESLAARRGAFVALSAYLIYAGEVAAMSNAPLATGLDFFMASLLASGWLAFPVAFFAGIMAYRAREGALRYRVAAPDRIATRERATARV